MKLLTVTVPCYNSEAYMEKCIESLLPGGDRIEIIIINDGSKDRTGEIADSYAARFPDIVRAVHQENGGHGEGINQGLRHATGRYFKTVDSDDWLSEDLGRFLDLLEECDRQGGADLIVTNYYYDHADGKGNHSVVFSNALPEERIVTWSETKPFRFDQVLMIHACTFRTELLRSSGLEMPKHIFYEDNYMIYGNLGAVERICYMNADLYHYYIGREGQSVQKEVMAKRYAHQIKATELCWNAYHLGGIANKRKLAYLKHEMVIMFCISILHARVSYSEKAEEDLKSMWARCSAHDRKWAKRMRRVPVVWAISLPGKSGAAVTRFFYKLSHSIVRFN